MDSKQPIYIDDDSHDHSDSEPKIKMKFCGNSTHYALTVSPDSTFGDLKRLILQETGLETKKQRLFFKVIEKDDEACLPRAGLKNNSKLLLGEDTTYGEEIKVEVVKKYSVPSKGCEVVAVVRSEDDKLAEKVAALKTVMCGGTKLAEKDIIFLTEMLERQLLKLDGIHAEGEGRIQRKMEVDRVQGLVDTIDDLKAKNYATPVADDTTYLKRHISQETGLEPMKQRLFIKVIEKQNEACLQWSGLKNNSKLLLKEDTTYGEEIKISVPSKGCEFVAVIKSEDDKLAEQVVALKTVVCGGAKVAEKDIIFLTEMLERQLLKLDDIQAEGEGRIQRKTEVDRVQSLVDTMDDLKAKSCATPVADDTTYLKRHISQETGLEPKKQRLFFKVIEKDNEACLQRAGLKNNSKLLLREDTAYGEEIKNSVPSKGCEVVAVVRSEDDKLAEQVAALETVVCGGTKVAEKYIIFLTEMLERQLLKLDGIQAEGEGKIQRKMEVRRVQSLVDTMDDLKAKNYATAVVDDVEATRPNIDGCDAESPMSSSTEVVKGWEVFGIAIHPISQY